MTQLGNASEAKAWLRDTLGCKDETLGKLERFVTMLSEENRVQNLVSADSLEEVWVRHIADSAQLLLHVPRETNGTWLDLGSGAGFPGLVVAILKPDIEVRMVESRKKRGVWLNRAAKTLELPKARVEPVSLERLASLPAAVISARAFAPLDRLIALSSRFSTDETRWILPKGRNGAKELSEMNRNVQRMFHVEPSRTDAASVILVGRGVPR